MVSDRWLKVGTVFGIIACVAFAAACGGGGGGGGGASTTVAMALSFPSGAAKPGTSDDGAVGKTMISLATVIVINTAGTEYTLTEPDSANNPGVYSGSVTGLSEGDSLIIKARKGELELSKLIPNVIMLGAATTTYDAGEVDTTSTAFTEIVKESADNLAADLSLTGVDVTDGTDDLSELIQNLSSIIAEIDLVQLYTEVTDDAIGVDYSAMRTAVDTACQAAVTSGSITTLSVLEEGSTAFSAL